MIQKQYMDFTCATGLLAKRFVTITKSTDTVAYTVAGAKPDGITIGDESNLKISIQLLGNLNSSFWFDSVGVIAKGGEVEVGVDGKGQIQASGAIACYAKIAAVADSFGVGYNIGGTIGSAVGTPGVGMTSVEESIGSWHKTTITVPITTVLPAIAGGADLAVGVLIYTLPAGAKIIKSGNVDIALDELDGNITADTPDVGIGTVIGTGAVSVLGGTGTFEDIVTGRAAADCNGTATVGTAMPTGATGGLVIEVGDAHTIHFNVADGWAASGEAACPVTGTAVIEWLDV